MIAMVRPQFRQVESLIVDSEPWPGQSSGAKKVRPETTARSASPSRRTVDDYLWPAGTQIVGIVRRVARCAADDDILVPVFAGTKVICPHTTSMSADRVRLPPQ